MPFSGSHPQGSGLSSPTLNMLLIFVSEHNGEADKLIVAVLFFVYFLAFSSYVMTFQV